MIFTQWHFYQVLSFFTAGLCDAVLLIPVNDCTNDIYLNRYKTLFSISEQYKYKAFCGDRSVKHFIHENKLTFLNKLEHCFSTVDKKSNGYNDLLGMQNIYILKKYILDQPTN